MLERTLRCLGWCFGVVIVGSMNGCATGGDEGEADGDEQSEEVEGSGEEEPIGQVASGIASSCKTLDNARVKATACILSNGSGGVTGSFTCRVWQAK